MKKIFLSSSFKDVCTIFADFEKNIEGKTVTFIPTASIVEKVVFYVEAGKKALEKLGAIVDVLELSTATADEIRLEEKIAIHLELSEIGTSNGSGDLSDEDIKVYKIWEKY